VSATADERRWLDVNRIVFFNDAIFAIAMTVLVFGFQVPEGLGNEAEPDLVRILRHQWDDFLGYFLSFAVLAFYWIAHHRLFDHVKRADRWVLYLNLVFLSFVALLPYPSELLQHYGDTKVATVFWAATIVLAGSAFTALVVHAVRGHLVDPPFEAAYRRHAVLRHGSVPIVFAASIPVAFLSVAAAKFVWLLLPLSHVVFRRRYGSIHDAR
jgi:uncharacterized membrane protein